MVAALAPSLFVGGGNSASSDVDATKTVLDGVSDTGRPTIERPANPPAIAGNTFTEYSGSKILTSSDPAVDLDATMGDNAGGDNIGDLVHTVRTEPSPRAVVHGSRYLIARRYLLWKSAVPYWTNVVLPLSRYPSLRMVSHCVSGPQRDVLYWCDQPGYGI